jgi:hypothetical protein
LRKQTRRKERYWQTKTEMELKFGIGWLTCSLGAGDAKCSLLSVSDERTVFFKELPPERDLRSSGYGIFTWNIQDARMCLYWFCFKCLSGTAHYTAAHAQWWRVLRWSTRVFPSTLSANLHISLISQNIVNSFSVYLNGLSGVHLS